MMQRAALVILSAVAVAAGRGGREHEMSTALPQSHSEEFLAFVARYGKTYCSSGPSPSSAEAEEEKKSGLHRLVFCLRWASFSRVVKCLRYAGEGCSPV